MHQLSPSFAPPDLIGPATQDVGTWGTFLTRMAKTDPKPIVENAFGFGFPYSDMMVLTQAQSRRIRILAVRLLSLSRDSVPELSVPVGTVLNTVLSEAMGQTPRDVALPACKNAISEIEKISEQIKKDLSDEEWRSREDVRAIRETSNKLLAATFGDVPPVDVADVAGMAHDTVILAGIPGKAANDVPAEILSSFRGWVIDARAGRIS